MSTVLLAHRAKPKQVDESKTSLFDCIPRELRDTIYRLHAADLRVYSGPDLLDLTTYQVSGPSGASKQIRQEWHEAYHTETAIDIDLGRHFYGPRHPEDWLDIFGEPRVRRLRAVWIDEGDYSVGISLDGSSFEVHVESNLERYRGGVCSGVFFAPATSEEKCQSIKDNVESVLKSCLEPDEPNGTLYFDCPTLHRVIRGISLGFASPEYKFLWEQPDGPRDSLPIYWSQHCGAVRDKMDAQMHSWSGQEQADYDPHCLPLNAILDSIAEAGDEDKLPVGFEEVEKVETGDKDHKNDGLEPPLFQREAGKDIEKDKDGH